MAPDHSPVRWEQVVALYGGAFDPPHCGHREAVRGLLKTPGVGRVRVLPTGKPALKALLASAEHRLAMARLNFAPTSGDPAYPGGALVEVDAREIERARKTGLKTYTAETLDELGSALWNETGERPAVVIGTDALPSLPGWRRFPEILGLAHWIVLTRGGTGDLKAQEAAQETLRAWEGSGLIAAETGTGGLPSWRIRVAHPRPAFLVLAPTDAPGFSSTEIRETAGRTGRPPLGSLLPEVEAYLKQHRLYGTEELVL